MTDEQHRYLLAILDRARSQVMISGYWSSLYGERLASPQWRRSSFLAMTRGGSLAQEWLWINYEPPVKLHDHRLVGRDFREREKIKRRIKRWTAKLAAMQPLERSALLAALQDLPAVAGEGSGAIARTSESGQAANLTSNGDA